MEHQEPLALLTSLLRDTENAYQIAKTAGGAKKSLRGDGTYAAKFHAVVIALSTTERKLQPVLAGLELDAIDLDNFNRDLSVLKSDDAKPKDRTDSLKRLQLLCQSVIVPKIQALTANPIPATEQVIPMAVVKGTRRGYLENIVIQANGNYEHQWYDACSVMIRKLVEVLIILTYEAKRQADEVKDGEGNFFMLSGLIGAILKKNEWNLGRETKKYLPDIKELGDRAAHNRHYLAKKQDIDNVKSGLRVIVDDLLHQAGLK